MSDFFHSFFVLFSHVLWTSRLTAPLRVALKLDMKYPPLFSYIPPFMKRSAVARWHYRAKQSTPQPGTPRCDQLPEVADEPLFDRRTRYATGTWKALKQASS